MGPEAEHVFKSFVYADTESADKYEDVMNKIDGHFVPKRNVIFERAKFHSKVQTAGESVEAFIQQLYELADNCDFGALKDEQIRDRLVIGICDKRLSQKLQMQSDLTLRDATEMARHSELVKTQNAERAAAAERVEELRMSFKNKKDSRRYEHNAQPSTSQRKQYSDRDRCVRCGRSHSAARDKKIVLKVDAQPYSVATPRHIPVPLLPKVEEELRRMETLGIIEKVTEPTEWSAPMVPVVKRNGKIRICVDLKKFNESVKREKVHPTKQ